MRSAFLLLILCPVFWMQMARADDVEAYFPGGSPHSVFVHVVMDLGNSDLDPTLCTYGVDCGPPFMSELAHTHLGDMYLPGQAVTAPGVFKAVLAAVLENPLFDDHSLSLLISNHQDNSLADTTAGLGGGTVLQGYRRLQGHRSEFVSTLKSLPLLTGGNAHYLQPGETYFEWLRYLRGGDVALGKNTRGNFAMSDPLPDYDANIITNGKYSSPITESNACPRLYSILYTQSVPARDDDLNSEIAVELPGLDQPVFAEMLSYLHRNSTDLMPQVETPVPLLKTWVVTSRDRPGDAQAYAIAGGSGNPFFVEEPLVLQAQLTRALAGEIRVAGSSLDATFARDTFTLDRVLDDVFLPYFSPQASRNWPGNIKKLKLLGHSSLDGESEGDRQDFDRVIDARGLPAFALEGEGKGQLRLDALTFWTDVAALPPLDGELIPDGADGPLVTRGGAGQKIDGFANHHREPEEVVHHFIGNTNADTPINGYRPRQLYYEPAYGSSLLPFDANAETVAALKPLLDDGGTLGMEELLDLLRWARGQDTQNGKTSARSWLMGEVLHSRPLALNYGATPGYSKQNPNVRVLFGSGDGIFHIVENTDTGGRESGREVFGFFPRESVANIRWRHDGTTVQARRYGVDGAPVALRVDHNADGTVDFAAGDEAYVYFGLRRGGDSYFALDISNPDATPVLVWKISRTVDGAFDELGLTFSTPVVGKVNYSGKPVDVLVFAGGYDGGWDANFSERRGKDLDAEDSSVGNAIFIVNARTGDLVWKAVRGNTGGSSNTRYAHAGLVDSMPSGVSALLTPAGIIHRLYVGDSGGAVWRVDLPPNPGSDENHRRDHWFITKLADLGADAAEPGGTASDDRRFFHAPDIVQTYDASGDFDGVLIASGNRADPNETLVQNALFYIKDRETASGSAAVQAENGVNHPPGRYQLADLADQTGCIDGSEIVSTGEGDVACADRGLENGWQVHFSQPGEKGLSTPLTDGGRVFASTYTPPEPTACSSQLGQGSLYVLRLANATAVAGNQIRFDLGEGIPAAPEPVGSAIFLPGQGIDLYDLDDDGVRDTSKLLPSQAGTLYRTYWREPGIDPL